MKNKIGLKTEAPQLLSINEAVDLIIKRKWVLAPFQRPNVWKIKQQRELLQSLIEGIPIGNIILKKYDNITQQVREIPGIEINNKSTIEHIIIDGQQRLSFLSWLRLKKENEKFKNGPKYLFKYNLKKIGTEHDKILNEKRDVINQNGQIREKTNQEYLSEGIIIINNYFDPNYSIEVSNSIEDWDQKEYKDETTYLRSLKNAKSANENLNSVFNSQQRIVAIKANKNADEKFGFRLYEVVNKSGIKLKGIDYIDGALYQICPQLFENVNDSIESLSQIPSSDKKTSSVKSVKAYSKIFTRANYTRTIIDELYKTPNPEERNKKDSNLSKLMAFGDATNLVGSKLSTNDIINAFEKVKKGFIKIKEILQKDLYFKNDDGINPTFIISANALFRNNTRVDIKTKGKFIRWFILFHINEDPYLGKQDYKVKKDCVSAGKADFKLLIENLVMNAKNTTSEKGLMFRKETFLKVVNSKINWETNSESKNKFLKKIIKFLTINNCARDWLFDYNISDIDVGHLDEHHIFPKNLFDFSKLTDEEKKIGKKRRDNPANIAHIHWTSNSSKLFKQSPETYFPEIKKRKRYNELNNHLVPTTPKNLDFKKYDDFIIERINLIVKYANQLLDTLELGKWDDKISYNNSDEYFFENIQNVKFLESETLEYKTYFCMFNGELSKNYACFLYKEVCAFLNTRGGVIWIGIDDKRKIVGLGKELELIKEKLKSKGNECDETSILDFFQRDFKQKFTTYLPRELYTECISAKFVDYMGKKLFKISITPTVTENRVEMKLFQKFNEKNKQWEKRDKSKGMIVIRSLDSSEFL